MRSIGVLVFVRKKKRAWSGKWGVLAAALLFFVLSAVAAQPSADAAEAGKDAVLLQTPSSGAVIATDPETGTRVMQTPKPKKQESYQGPQTVIVTPEVHMDAPRGKRPSSGRGNGGDGR